MQIQKFESLTDMIGARDWGVEIRGRTAVKGLQLAIARKASRKHRGLGKYRVIAADTEEYSSALLFHEVERTIRRDEEVSLEDALLISDIGQLAVTVAVAQLLADHAAYLKMACRDSSAARNPFGRTPDALPILLLPGAPAVIGTPPNHIDIIPFAQSGPS